MRGHNPAISFNGHELVFDRCEASRYNCEIFVAGFEDGRATGAPRQLTHDHRRKSSPHWTHDGKEIIYIAGETTSALPIYRVRASAVNRGPSKGWVLTHHA